MSLSLWWVLTWSTLSMPEWRATSLELLWVTWSLTYSLPFIHTFKSNTRHVWSIPKAKSFMSRSLLRASWACLEVSRVLSTFSSKTWFSPFIKWDYLCTFKVMIHDHLFNTVLSRSKWWCWLWVCHLHLLHVLPDVVVLLHQVLVHAVLHLHYVCVILSMEKLDKLL